MDRRAWKTTSLGDLDDLVREQSGRNLRSALNESDLEEEGQLVYWEIGESIGGLYQLESHILHPAPHDALINIGHFQATHTEDADTRMVLTRYPHTTTWTAARLGAANSRRRALLEYYKESYHKMFGEHDKISSDHGREESVRVELSSSRQHSSFSLFDYSRYKVRVSIPAPPSGPNMICSLCFHLVEVGDLESWVQHLHTDLKPYICLAPSCADHLFDGRAEWKKHLYDDHKIHEPKQSMPRCPLCYEMLPDPLILEEHIGMHLEELCLLVLTPDAINRVPSPDVTAVDVPEMRSTFWFHFDTDHAPVCLPRRSQMLRKLAELRNMLPYSLSFL
ncbi:unnamed protein product [Penicillium viridicatum]